MSCLWSARNSSRILDSSPRNVSGKPSIAIAKPSVPSASTTFLNGSTCCARPFSSNSLMASSFSFEASICWSFPSSSLRVFINSANNLFWASFPSYCWICKCNCVTSDFALPTSALAVASCPSNSVFLVLSSFLNAMSALYLLSVSASCESLCVIFAFRLIICSAKICSFSAYCFSSSLRTEIRTSFNFS